MNRYTLPEFFEKIRFWLFGFSLFHAFLFLDFKNFSKIFGIKSEKNQVYILLRWPILFKIIFL